jgi:hypothetical protein
MDMFMDKEISTKVNLECRKNIMGPIKSNQITPVITSISTKKSPEQYHFTVQYF